MTYLNTAVATAPGPPPIDLNLPHLETPLAEYDVNYVLPVKVLETHAVRVEPFIPRLHMRDTHEAWTHTSAASIYTYMPFDAPSSLSEFFGRVEWVRSMPSRCVLAVFDKQPEGCHLPAGTISLANTDVANLSVELAPVVIFPDFQRTHVLTHAISVLLTYLFEDLGLRRVQWSADKQHEASIAAAARLGFTEEGILKWHWVLPKGKIGLEIDTSETLGRPLAGSGRHSVILAITWEDWKDSVKARLDALTAREVIRK